MSDIQNGMKTTCDVLERLWKLKDAGIINEDEYLAKKADMLERLSLQINPDYMAGQNGPVIEQERPVEVRAAEEQLVDNRKREAEQINVEFNRLRVEDDTRVSDEETVRQEKAVADEEAAPKKKNGAVWKVIGAVLVVIVLALGYVKVIMPANTYKSAVKLMESGEYESAIEQFKGLGDYKDASEMIQLVSFEQALARYRKGDITSAIELLTAMGDYPAAQEKLPELMLEYVEELLLKEDYLTALDYLKKCGNYDYAKELVDETARRLLNEQRYDAAIEYHAYLYKNDADKMAPIYYDYLNWQFDNHDYTAVAETYEKIKDYKDVATNEKFNGARLISAGKLVNSNTEFHGLLSATMLNFTFEFSSDGELNFNIHGSEISLVTYQIETKVDIDSAWSYRFEGNKIFLKDEENTDGKFLEVGQIVKFNKASRDKKASVTLALDLPGSMNFVEASFEYDGYELDEPQDAEQQEESIKNSQQAESNDEEEKSAAENVTESKEESVQQATQENAPTQELPPQTTIPEKVLPTAISISSNEITTREGYTLHLEVTLSPENTTETELSWASSNTNIAKVDSNGIVLATDVGETTITVAAANGLTATCKVIVEEAIFPNSIAMKDALVELEIGETYSTEVLYSPESTTERGGTWESSNTSVATVDNQGIVTAVGEGTVVITHRMTWMGLSASYEIAVVPRVSLQTKCQGTWKRARNAEAGLYETITFDGQNYSLVQDRSEGDNPYFSGPLYIWGTATFAEESVTIVETKAGRYRKDGSWYDNTVKTYTYPLEIGDGYIVFNRLPYYKQ